MKKMACVALLTLMSAPLAAASPPDSPMAPVKSFLDAFNKGDIASMTAAQRDSNFAIMDEVPPHIWLGPKAVDAWLASLDGYDKAHGRTDGVVAVSKPQVLTVEGDRAYAVAPAVYSFKEKGKAMRETATMTFALHHTTAGWKIAGWTWNGTVPKAARK